MTPFLWVLVGGFVSGIVLLILFSVGKKKRPVGILVSLILSVVCMGGFILDISLNPYKNGNIPAEEEVSTISFSELYRAYKENEIVADETYKGNRYRVTGEIVGISNDGLLNMGGGATLTVNVELDEVIVVLIATFEKGQIESLKSVKVGDTITFAGKCLSYGSWSECELILEE